MNQKDGERWKSQVLVAVVSFLEAQGIVPFTFPLPEGSGG
jgi:hypothetical protein